MPSRFIAVFYFIDEIEVVFDLMPVLTVTAFQKHSASIPCLWIDQSFCSRLTDIALERNQ